MNLVKEAKADLQKQIDKKIKPEMRPRTYIVFIDLKKAFDKVDRDKLM